MKTPILRREFLRRSWQSVAVAAGAPLLSTLGRIASASSADAPAGAVVATQYGRVRGVKYGRVHAFKGVPYGADTAGAARWLAPQPPRTWSGVLEARDYGPMCPQRVAAPVPQEQAVLQSGPMGEDCLRLHVWTGAPRERAARLPVMVWLHGGAYAGGSGGASSYDGTRLAARHNVVVVTVTHRLNAFGFLYLPLSLDAHYASSGEVGMLDCIAALQWVRDNIADFGGDAGSVTLFGQSGGAGKIACLQAMPSARGLFHRAIMQSGSQLTATPLDVATRRTQAVLAALGNPTLSQLQAIPAATLVETALANGFQAASPVVDGTLLPTHPFDPVAPSMSATTPLLIGSTETESTFFAHTPVANTPLDPIDDATFRTLVTSTLHLAPADADTLIDAFRAEYPGKDDTYLYQLLSTQWLFTDGVTTTAERKAEQKKAHVYLYAFNRHTSVQEGKLRSPHTIEIGYVFDNLAGSPIVGPVSDASQAIADGMSTAWVSFARSGNPNHAGIAYWQPYDSGERAVMSIDQEFALVRDPHRSTRELIRTLKQRQS